MAAFSSRNYIETSFFFSFYSINNSIRVTRQLWPNLSVSIVLQTYESTIGCSITRTKGSDKLKLIEKGEKKHNAEGGVSYFGFGRLVELLIKAISHRVMIIIALAFVSCIKDLLRSNREWLLIKLIFKLSCRFIGRGWNLDRDHRFFHNGGQWRCRHFGKAILLRTTVGWRLGLAA